jgi:uncharacterized membrane protein YbaN (DUF454 family)
MFFRKWIEELDDIPERFQNHDTVSVKQWMAILILMFFPVANVAILLYWAFSSKEERPASKVNWARAMLIVGIIMTCLTVAGVFLCLRLING